MRIALIYPPPWKLPAKDEAPYPLGEGAPTGYRDGDLDADFHQTPYGLFALGAQTLRAGHEVKVLNLSSYPWSRVREIVSALDADVYGMSCWTANRRGVLMLAEEIKRIVPKSKVIVGGPHATPLYKEILEHCRAIDSVCIGESDVTFLELVNRASNGLPMSNVAGSAWRLADGSIGLGPKRKNIDDLDQLACPQRYFPTHILMTSRGCPWSCTFCGAETSWGRGFRSNSIDYVLDAIERALAHVPVKMIQIKDDTFTTNKKRVIELCRAIRARKLSFFWSCDTRVDLLSRELLTEMRLAGCQRLSLGVESGSQRILDLIQKKISTDEILASTELAKEVGIKVRYYMMLGNRGDDQESFKETLDFLQRAKPHEYVFSCLSIYPGTQDFHDAEAGGWLNRDAYFTGDFQELKTPFDANDEDMRVMNEWFSSNSGLRTMHKDGSREYREILARLPDYHAAHLDLGAALYHEGDFEGAKEHVEKALALGYPCPGLAHNHLACIAKARGDLDGMMDHFSTAAKVDPQHWVLIKNVKNAREWFRAGGPGKNLPLQLDVRHDFQLLEKTLQPSLPGPLPDDFATWRGEALDKALSLAERDDNRTGPIHAVEGDVMKTPEIEGSLRTLIDRKHLKMAP